MAQAGKPAVRRDVRVDRRQTAEQGEAPHGLLDGGGQGVPGLSRPRSERSRLGTVLAVVCLLPLKCVGRGARRFLHLSLIWLGPNVNGWRGYGFVNAGLFVRC